MLTLLLLILFSVLIVAIINWKFSRKRAKFILFLLPLCMYIIGIFIIDLPSRLYPVSGLLIAVLGNLIFPLAFFAEDYIQYKKDKDNIETIKKTLNSALFYLACNLLIAVMLVYYFLVYFY